MTESMGWRPAAAVGAAFLALLVGIGLARFAYTPLVPALIDAGWFDAGRAAYLGAANLLGYLSGALISRQLARRLRPATALRGLMLLTAASFFACAEPASFAWFFLWRFLSGLSGGAIMALAALAVLPLVPPARRGLAGGLIFAGVGLGVVLSGTAVPFLLRIGPGFAWMVLGAVALAATMLAWFGWPDRPIEAATPGPAASRAAPLALKALVIAYATNAVGLVPHMLFLVDFIARGLGRGLAVGSGYWVVFGIGALVGPVLAGQTADRIGFARAYRLALLLQTLAIALAVLSHSSPALLASAFVVGAFTPGVVPLVLGRVQELTHGDAVAARAAWRRVTMSFALGQALAAYGFSFLFAETGSHELLFVVGAAVMAGTLALDLLVARHSAD